MNKFLLISTFFMLCVINGEGVNVTIKLNNKIKNNTNDINDTRKHILGSCNKLCFDVNRK